MLIRGGISYLGFVDKINSNFSTAVTAVLGFLLLLLLPFDRFLSLFNLPEFQAVHLGDIIRNLAIVVYGLVLIKKYGYGQISGIKTGRPKYLKLLLFPLYIVLLGPIWYWYFDYEFINVTAIDVLLLLAATLSVGFSEELIFRGFVLPHLIKGAPENQALLYPISIASLMFGLLHFLNFFDPDSKVPLIFAQVLYATFFGIAFGIILLKSRSLLSLGIVHGLINFAHSLDKLPGTKEPAGMDEYVFHEAAFGILAVLPFLIFSLNYLSSLEKSTIFSLYEER